MTRPCLALLLVLNVCTVAAQEHPFLSRFALTEGLGFVQLDWTMSAGNTCEGIDIYRSLDGSNFETVGTIPGICGDINSPVPFSWTDHSAPELTTVYYRLRLGLNGFSSVQRIDLTILGQQSTVGVSCTCGGPMHLAAPGSFSYRCGGQVVHFGRPGGARVGRPSGWPSGARPDRYSFRNLHLSGHHGRGVLQRADGDRALVRVHVDDQLNG